MSVTWGRERVSSFVTVRWPAKCRFSRLSRSSARASSGRPWFSTEKRRRSGECHTSGRESKPVAVLLATLTPHPLCIINLFIKQIVVESTDRSRERSRARSTGHEYPHAGGCNVLTIFLLDVSFGTGFGYRVVQIAVKATVVVCNHANLRQRLTLTCCLV